MTPDQYRKYAKVLTESALNAIIEKERNEQYEREQQGLMHQLDQDDQSIEDFCRGLE